jgi:hypothetical protein
MPLRLGACLAPILIALGFVPVLPRLRRRYREGPAEDRAQHDTQQCPPLAGSAKQTGELVEPDGIHDASPGGRAAPRPRIGRS